MFLGIDSFKKFSKKQVVVMIEKEDKNYER